MANKGRHRRLRAKKFQYPKVIRIDRLPPVTSQFLTVFDMTGKLVAKVGGEVGAGTGRTVTVQVRNLEGIDSDQATREIAVVPRVDR